MFCWGGSRGGSVEPLKLNVKTYNKRVVKKSEPTQLINISFENDLCLVENGLYYVRLSYQ